MLEEPLWLSMTDCSERRASLFKGAQSVRTLDRVAVVFESQPPFYV